MKPKISLLLFVLFMSLSVTSSAEWISVGAVWNGYNNTSGKLHDFWGGTVNVQTPVDWWLETSAGTRAEIQFQTTPYFFEWALEGQHKQGSVVLYPGDTVWLNAYIRETAQEGRYHQAVSYIYVHVRGAIQ